MLSCWVSACSHLCKPGKRCSAVPHVLCPHPPILPVLWRWIGQGHEAQAQHLLLPGLSHTHMHFPNLWYLQNEVWLHGCQWHSDTCDTVTPVNTENNALSQESHVNISVPRDLSSADSCHFPDPTNSIEATCPAVVWDCTPVRMNG